MLKVCFFRSDSLLEQKEKNSHRFNYLFIYLTLFVALFKSISYKWPIINLYVKQIRFWYT
jgi:hypothetical protein